MATIAYDYGNIIEVVFADPTGAQEHVIELECAGDRDETLESAGFSMIGEWWTWKGLPQADVQQKW